ncbi:hypothetical protein GpartN1_g5568.t1 [Galdieria partita]|uniref:Complex 1 LYR protein domain-containing protein n=1 Tax=Galdieria partita TaxID=83374 RepID=A0A9C7USL1_9RHOD|nr:hypothetical protein GpartN1_g5568.t1 [Galdieria partita]
MSQQSLKRQVLQLYRDILRVAKTWKEPDEAQYIREEADRLFHQNKNVASQEEIEEKLFEGRTRLELGIHYKIPYPRPYHVVPGATGKTRDMIKPAYMASYDWDLSHSHTTREAKRPKTRFEEDFDEEDNPLQVRRKPRGYQVGTS